MKERPNILLVTCDQLRHDVIGALGHPVVKTPNIDSLVENGVVFTRAYTESPVCIPARATLLTGQLPHRHGVVDNMTGLPPGRPTFVRQLADAGYDCHAIGKMHFRPPRADHGFATMRLCEELPASVDEDDYLRDLTTAGYPHVREPHGVRHELYYRPQPCQLPEELTSTAWTGRQTVDMLRSRGRDDPPFFCWTSFLKPHPPFDPPPPWSLMYDPVEMPDPVRAPEELDALPYHARRQHRITWTPPYLDLTSVRVMRAYYYALVSHVDHWVGEILAALDDTGERGRTLVVFTADHGEYLGDHWSFGKLGFHDAAARLPYLLSWPGTLPTGTTVDSLVGLADLAPTFTAAASCEDVPAADGHDLLPLARGEVDTVRETFFGQFSHGATGLYLSMDSAHKYVHSAADGRDMLFRIGTPPDDTVDLASDPSYAGVLDDLRGRLVERFVADGHTEALDGDTWRVYPPTDTPGTPDDRSVVGRGRQYARWRADARPRFIERESER